MSKREVVKLVSVSQGDLEIRADALAKRLGMSRTSAFKKMDNGTLPTSNTAIELKLVRHLMNKNGKKCPSISSLFSLQCLGTPGHEEEHYATIKDLFYWWQDEPEPVVKRNKRLSLLLSNQERVMLTAIAKQTDQTCSDAIRQFIRQEYLSKGLSRKRRGT